MIKRLIKEANAKIAVRKNFKSKDDKELFNFLDQVRNRPKSKENEKLQKRIEDELSFRQLDF